jgi:N-acyl homoserine lactone hydrolase
MNPRPPRRGPARLPRTLLASFFRTAQWYPVPVFIVEHPDAGPFLIDVGYDPSVSTDPTRTLGFLFGKMIMSHRVADRSVPEQVVERGVDPSDVSRVLATHLHLDHVSGSAKWPDARFVVDRAERVGAASRGPGPYVRSHLATIEHWQEIDYAEAEPFESFGRTFDLFEDGTVRLVSRPGHSPGHQSVEETNLNRLRDPRIR